MAEKEPVSKFEQMRSRRHHLNSLSSNIHEAAADKNLIGGKKPVLAKPISNLPAQISTEGNPTTFSK